MKKGDYVMTPRFCTVQITEVYTNSFAAKEAGYTEPTHYMNEEWDIRGKSLGVNRMQFAAIRKESR